jgi:hypothetical protein
VSRGKDETNEVSDEKKRLLTKEERNDYHSVIDADDYLERSDLKRLLDHADAADEEIEKWRSLSTLRGEIIGEKNDEIDSLRQQNDRLKCAIKTIASCADRGGWVRELAAKALRGDDA